MGAALMPAMAAAYSALPQAAVARAASAMEIVQRAGATLGIALLAVILQRGLSARGFQGSLDELDDAPPAQLAAAAAHTFTWALVLTAAALVPAFLLRPKRGRIVSSNVDAPPSGGPRDGAASASSARLPQAGDM